LAEVRIIKGYFRYNHTGQPPYKSAPKGSIFQCSPLLGRKVGRNTDLFFFNLLVISWISIS